MGFFRWLNRIINSQYETIIDRILNSFRSNPDTIVRVVWVSDENEANSFIEFLNKYKKKRIIPQESEIILFERYNNSSTVSSKVEKALGGDLAYRYRINDKVTAEDGRNVILITTIMSRNIMAYLWSTFGRNKVIDFAMSSEPLIVERLNCPPEQEIIDEIHILYAEQLALIMVERKKQNREISHDEIMVEALNEIAKEVVPKYNLTKKKFIELHSKMLEENYGNL